ncbi:DUF3467 domain-containing protein [Longibacter sp.]|jgi:hypothetical protein|uniref:DUF3467 domain-containing protein n=1 Tax=Longibacter sp. TaxID=2045415 RepID=UPI003EB6F39C
MEDFGAAQDPQEMNIEIDEETAEGTYANLVMVSHTPEEFVIDFIRMVPGVPKAKVKHRVLVTPSHAKRILAALEENVERYENAHGEIDPPDRPDRPMNFGGGVGEA